MPSSVHDLTAFAGANLAGVVAWGTPIAESGSGIYIISRSPDPHATTLVSAPELSQRSVEKLLSETPRLTVDGRRPQPHELLDRLSLMWLPDEAILYIGKATSIGKRVGQYYRTPIGARSPHSGGWPLKALAEIDELWVHWATHPRPELAEQLALSEFVDNVSEASKSRLHDPTHPFPFANLEGPGGRKGHGVSGARAARVSDRSIETSTTQPKQVSTPTPKLSFDNSLRTQRVTEADIKAGRIRVPRTSKGLLPDHMTEIRVLLRGETFDARWDPRLGPPERSGVITVGRERMVRLLEPEEVLHLSKGAAAALQII